MLFGPPAQSTTTPCTRKSATAWSSCQPKLSSKPDAEPGVLWESLGHGCLDVSREKLLVGRRAGACAQVFRGLAIAVSSSRVNI